METVSVVRKDIHIKELKEELGAKHVFNQTSEGFMEDMAKVCAEIKPTIMFECLGGDLSGNIFSKMP